MGPSGSGKSTLLHLLAGLDTPTEGKVFIGDIDLTTLSDKQLTQLRRDRVGFVFQAFNLIPTLTAGENITLPLDIAGKDVDKSWFDTVVDTVGLTDRLHHRPAELSGGQQQRVAGARALVSRPEIVFADEPTGNLDSKSGAELLDFLRERRRRARADDRDGDARRARRRARRPGRLPRATATSWTRCATPTADAILDRIKSLEASVLRATHQEPARTQAPPGR